MATVDPETQAHATAGVNFLGLPPEVRNMIYRLLLVADKPLSGSKYEREMESEHNSGREWASLGEHHLQPAMLRVCWQLYREGSHMLNRENTFGIRIRIVHPMDDNGIAMSSFRCSSINDGLSSFWDSSMDKFQRFEILILEAEYIEVKSSVEELCRCCLSKSHALQHVSIYLYDTLEEDYEALGPFGMLRNLRSVDIHGAVAPRQYAKRLRRLMLGNTPPEDLHGMYLMLQKYVKDLKGDRSDLKTALKAVRRCDVQKFKEIRSKIISDVRDHVDPASRHLLEFDPKMEDHQATNVTVEDPMALPKDENEPQAEEIPRNDWKRA